MQQDQTSSNISIITEPSNYVDIDKMTLAQISNQLIEIEESISKINKNLEIIGKKKQYKMNLKKKKKGRKKNNKKI